MGLRDRFLLLVSQGLAPSQTDIAGETMYRLIIVLFAITFALAIQAGPITYQGQLQDSSGPADIEVDIVFELYEQDEGGSPIASDSHDDVVVTDGLFQVELDFGSGVFDGSERWLEVIVDGQELTPRQRITAAPVAIHALNAPTDNLEDDFWKQGGNAGTDSASDFLGTTDDAPFEIRVDGQRVVRFEPAGGPDDAANWIGGHPDNTVQNNRYGQTIGGGGSDGHPNMVTGNLGTVGGGGRNLAGAGLATVSGGWGGEATGPHSTIAGGQFNVADGGGASIGGGSTNMVLGLGATVGGGRLNLVEANYGTISGGGPSDTSNAVDTRNVIYDHYGTIGGGGGNQAGNDDGDPESAEYATVGGGWENSASDFRSTVGGGGGNTASGSRATIAGGGGNTASSLRATIGGGGGNIASGEGATIGGGFANLASADFATIAGGGPSDISNPVATRNAVHDHYGTVGGGGNNQAGTDDGNPANAQHATVGGGSSNIAMASNATIGGGFDNLASGNGSTVPGGIGNFAGGVASFAAGRTASAGHDGAIVFGDSSSVAIVSDNDDEVRFQHEKFFIGEGDLTTGSGASLHYDTATGELLVNTSSARYKSEIRDWSPEPGAVLALEPRAFVYTESGTRSVGLIAEDVAVHLPDLVRTDTEGRPDSVAYNQLAVALIPELRRQHDRITKIDHRNEALEEHTQSLVQRIANLEAENAQLRQLAERNAKLEGRLAALEALLLEDRQVAESQQ
jgi:trimeric autotransporter adhesin